MRLTVKQQKFADEYIRLGEVTKAAINAGYSTKSAYAVGSENLKKPSIKSYIDKRLEELKKESIAEQDEILQYLTSVMRGEMTEQTLVGQGEGYQEIDNIDVGAKDRIKAAELLGKRYRMWTEKVEAEVTTPIFVDDVPEDD
ncbi:terminase [Staphylococcus hominis]|uniref:terminase small subunit n=1 Tax=Staphylococcus hominis TaxID=1290 RepID=UPI0008FB2A43|nr:terminase small subunit [Staphylococcus hominis]KAF1683677.1 terminase [Staphylococcus hominis]OIS43842.1 terminase [Staphylococcus hominis]OIS49292.1 terminase [Staphylococcus hominis]OIS50288.1 terminase [Staphylococcus hominis]